MARKKKPSQAVAIETRVRIWSCKEKLAFLSDAPQCGSGYVLHAVVDVGRPFRHHVPSTGKGPSGLVIEGMGTWTASQILSAARFGLFGFTLEDA